MQEQTVQPQPPVTQTNLELTLDPLNDGISSLELIRVSGSDVDIVNAARVSYGKFVDTITERDGKLLQFLMDHGHTSPFEHNQLSFRVKCPLYVSKQWMRHRMNSYNEISYRYVQAPVEFYVPQAWRFQDKNNKQSSVGGFENSAATEQYKTVIETAFKTYEQLLEAGICREQARGVLPTCTYTQFIFTCNLHSLMHFLTLRLHTGAQYEIRMYALAMLRLALPHFPVSLKAWQKKNMPEGISDYDLIKFGNE
ncbi:MAG: FAD-dependent thymidylate synthase [Candidatus Dependentiae bacterium]|nr:FAD-dependent thymidylate synthase [Candidatus Dependentiae bacterium]